MKYKQWVFEWLENYVKPTSKGKTYKRYLEIVNQHILIPLGEYEMEDLTPIILQRFISTLLTHGNIKTNAGLSVNSVNGIINVIQTSLKVAYHSGMLLEYSADRIKRPKAKEKEITCFTKEEQAKIENYIIATKKYKLFGIILCLYTGLRIGELLALEWQDIDLIEGTVSITKNCYEGKDDRGNIIRIIDTPKTQSSIRTIPFPKQLIPFMKKLKKVNQCPYVVASQSKPIQIRSYQRSLELLLKKLRLDHKGFHSLRHTFATRAIECGIDVKTLSEILGHKNPSVTLNRYVHSLMNHKKEMMNKVGKLFQSAQ